MKKKPFKNDHKQIKSRKPAIDESRFPAQNASIISSIISIFLADNKM